ncbi:MAG: hypothetical protein Q8O41_10685 [Candidatus Methanoperedens sp.]|nr:hypothetical protein [Candidatus Methanoperedens sp.]
MEEYKFIIHKIDRQSNFLKLELPKMGILGKFNTLGGKVMAQFFAPKGVEITKEIRDAFIEEASKLLKRKLKNKKHPPH